MDEIINRKVVVLHRFDSVYQASRAMKVNNIGCVIVADQNSFVAGMVTDRDLACGISSRTISQNTSLDAVMNRGLIWATEKESLDAIIQLMIDHGIRRIPIVGRTPRGRARCVGFVSLDDLICYGAITIDQASRIVTSQVKPNQPVERDLVGLTVRNTVFQASQALCDNNVGSLIVVNDNGILAGIVTDRDVALSLASHDVFGESNVTDVMKSPVVGASRGSSADDIIDLMVDYGVRRVPLVEFVREGRTQCVGLVTLDDLLAKKQISIAQAAQVIGAQVIPKSRRIPKKDRSEARREQTESEFCKFIARETGLTEDDARESTFCFLETLFRRVSPGAANDIASQLPLKWKEYLTAFMTGPNKRVSVDELVDNIGRAVNASSTDARRIAHDVYVALRYLTAGQGLDHLVGQLPRPFRDVFGGFKPVQNVGV